MAAFVAALLLLGACDTADDGAADSVADPPDVVDAGGDAAGCPPVAVDLLWVVDDSTSMCQEQAALADGFAAFRQALGAEGAVDLRTAVVTTSVLLPETSLAFQTTPAVDFPPLCQERRPFPAREDLDCACAACTGWDAAYAYVCGQDVVLGCPGDPEAQAPDYEACLAAGGCEDAPLAALWRAELPVGGAENLYNANGSVNGACRFRCGAEAGTMEQARREGTTQCREWFADETMVCQVPELGISGCLRPPDTAGCPADLPGVLPSFDEEGALRHGLESFRCLSTVGANAATAANLEQGLAAAWLALSDEGPHPLQVCDPADAVLADETLTTAEQRARCARRFLRPDAWLVVVFVSDEDDCSVREGAVIKAEDYNRCALLGDADTEPRAQPRAMSTDDRPLATVASFVNRLRSLRPDPARVAVAAFAGDAWSPAGALTREEREAAWEAYYASVTDRYNPLALNTSIASGPHGRANLGRRYIQLAEAFGDHGFFHNIVAGVPTGMEALARDIAALVGGCAGE